MYVAGEISSIEISYEQRFIIRAICYITGVNKNISRRNKKKNKQDDKKYDREKCLR
jgi:hypothetical protein